MIAKYAHYRNLSGFAVRTADRRVLFVDHDACGQVLGNEDIPFLVLLGDVNTAEAQHLSDVLSGGAAQIACSRGGVA